MRAFLVAVASACPEANHVHGLLQVAQALCWEGRAAWRVREAMAGAGGGRGASWWSDPEEMEEVFVSEGEDAPPADPLAPPRGPPPPVPVNEPVHLPRRKKECSQKISMAISQALLERGQSSEVILTTFDEDIPVTGDVGLIHVRIGKLRGEHLRSPWAVWTGSQSEGEDLLFDRDRDDRLAMEAIMRSTPSASSRPSVAPSGGRMLTPSSAPPATPTRRAKPKPAPKPTSRTSSFSPMGASNKQEPHFSGLCTILERYMRVLFSRTTLYMHSGAAALDDLRHASVGHAAGDRAEGSVDPPADTRPGLDLAFEFCDVPRAFSKRAFGLWSLLHSPCSLVPVPFTLGARYSTTTPMTSRLVALFYVLCLATVIVSSRMLRSICIRRGRRWLASATVHHIASTSQRQRDMLLEYLLEVRWILLIHVVAGSWYDLAGHWGVGSVHMSPYLSVPARRRPLRYDTDTSPSRSCSGPKSRGHRIALRRSWSLKCVLILLLLQFQHALGAMADARVRAPNHPGTLEATMPVILANSGAKPGVSRNDCTGRQCSERVIRKRALHRAIGRADRNPDGTTWYRGRRLTAGQLRSGVQAASPTPLEGTNPPATRGQTAANHQLERWGPVWATLQRGVGMAWSRGQGR